MLHLPDSAGSKYTCGNKFSDISQAHTFPPIKHLFLVYLSVCLFKSRWQTMFTIELAVFLIHLTCLFHNKSFKTKTYTLKSIFTFSSPLYLISSYDFLLNPFSVSVTSLILIVTLSSLLYLSLQLRMALMFYLPVFASQVLHIIYIVCIGLF